MEWILSLGALVISVAALAHALYSGPTLFANIEILYIWEDDHYVVTGAQLTVFNTGRSALPIVSIGAGPGIDGQLMLAKTRQLPGQVGRVNPTFPLSLEPGGGVSVYLTDELKPDENVKIIYLKRNWRLRAVRAVWHRSIRASDAPGAIFKPGATNAS